MKKIILFILLTVSTNVFSEWTKIAGNNAWGDVVYVDYGTIKKKGKKVKMWRLLDFKIVKKVGGYKYFSEAIYDEYDCEEETSRMLDVFWYSENNGKGDIVNSSKNIKNETQSILPMSINAATFKIACDINL
jgi:hypothetical protein